MRRLARRPFSVLSCWLLASVTVTSLIVAGEVHQTPIPLFVASLR